MAVVLGAKICSFVTFKTINRTSKPDNDYKLKSRCNAALSSQAALPSRRHVVVLSASFVTVLALNCFLTPLQARAKDESTDQEEERDDGVVGAIKSLFDPNEKTKSGKLLPKAYLKSAREVVKNLRESLKEDTKDNARFRRTADAAKESIREYLGSWRGQEKVVREVSTFNLSPPFEDLFQSATLYFLTVHLQESYVELEKAIRSLASFYSKAGPSAPLPEEVRSDILNDLNTAEEFL
ncbi:hypothetical protein DKX38_013115 [Salix brachista]|uniref:Photosystem II D1 processing protein PSB27-H2, chloroplastic n=1 Tax=Salix brachista TaxID=2182728 RepID=A0A5N5LQJ7_9ROSI|nr:hypothetical protein DKX38_013115 [Salix brachista]